MKHWYPLAILTAEQSSQADQLTEQSGIPGNMLMQNAGTQAATILLEQMPETPTLVICGPGNNGGDGFVVARRLQEDGWPVSLCCTHDPDNYQGDAATARDAWLEAGGTITPWESIELKEVGLAVDAIFGVGLNRPIEGKIARIIDALNADPLPIASIDIASGIHANTGETLGTAIDASHTLTFFRAKVGHYLNDGASHRGNMHILPIGIPDDTLTHIKPQLFEHHPELWHGPLPPELAVLGTHPEILRALQEKAHLPIESPHLLYAERMTPMEPPNNPPHTVNDARQLANDHHAVILMPEHPILLASPGGLIVLQSTND